MNQADIGREWALCEASPVYFLRRYGWLFNATEESWLPFGLWPAQAAAVVQVMRHPLVVILKARQLGFTWLMLGVSLWLMLFRPAAVIGIFSQKEQDAQELLDFRLKGMYHRLPAWMQAQSVLADNRSRWVLSNGSMALAFPTTGGRGYTFNFVLVDEGDHQPDLAKLMVATKPTIDAGGTMVLLSTADKAKPASRFKQIYRGAKQGLNGWHPIFLPWWARPGRTMAWYAEQRRDTLANTGSLDDLHQEYPATDTEALAPRTLDKRIPGPWIEKCFREMAGIPLAGVKADGDEPQTPPAIAGLTVYRLPEEGAQYVIGCDPAEGNPTSDDSALAVLERESGEEVAALAGKLQPAVLAAYVDEIGRWYNRAVVMVERNNHGHAVLLWLRDNSRLRVLDGADGRPGWHSTSLGKAMLYDALAEAFRGSAVELHSFAAYVQLASIEGGTLRAPEGEHDDRADAFALAHIGREYALKSRRKVTKVI